MVDNNLEEENSKIASRDKLSVASGLTEAAGMLHQNALNQD